MSAAIVERVQVHRLAVPLTVPYRLSFGAVERFDTLVVECETRDGAVGLGEATVLTGYTDETIEDSWTAAQGIAAEIAGLASAEARRRVERHVSERPFTATAFGTALEMLEGAPELAISQETAVPILGLLGSEGEAAMQRDLERLLAEGYRTLKVKVGTDAKKDIAHVRLAQRLLAGRARIRLDANQGYSAEAGVEFVRALDPEGIELFEQPCAAGDWDAHMRVVRAAGVPMMVDESIYGLEDIERAAKLGAAKYVKLKLMKMGSLAALAQGLERIRALGMTPVLGNGVACDPGCWMEACIAARHIDNAGEMNGFLKARAQVLDPPLEVRDAAIRLKPGYAPRLVLERARPFLIASHHESSRGHRVRRA